MPSKTKSKLSSLLSLIKESEADIACIQEVNDSMPRSSRSKFSSLLRRSFNKSASFSVATCTDRPRESTYQPGGSLIVNTSNIQHSPRYMKDNVMGRWSHTLLPLPPCFLGLPCH